MASEARGVAARLCAAANRHGDLVLGTSRRDEVAALARMVALRHLAEVEQQPLFILGVGEFRLLLGGVHAARNRVQAQLLV